MKPYFALRINHRSPKRSANDLLTLNGVLTYVFFAAVGPASGFLAQIFAAPQGTITKVPGKFTTLGHDQPLKAQKLLLGQGRGICALRVPKPRFGNGGAS